MPLASLQGKRQKAKGKSRENFWATKRLKLEKIILILTMNNYAKIPERTFNFAVRITNLCNHLDKQPGTPRLLASQLFRSGTSIGANGSESESAHSKKDFIVKREIALKEAKETRYWLRLIIKSEIIPSEKVSKLLDECEQIIKILAKSIVTAKENC